MSERMAVGFLLGMTCFMRVMGSSLGTLVSGCLTAFQCKDLFGHGGGSMSNAVDHVAMSGE
jgi:hypothetical protein